MKNMIALATLAVWSCAALMAQAQAPAQSKGPHVKSQKEAQAYMAIVNATTPDARIAAADDFVTHFADSELKGMALYLAAASAQQKNDYDKMMVYGNQALEADPTNYGVMLMLATGLAQHTREFDLDREEKLTKAEKYAHEAMALIKDAPKPRPDITDEQWESAKKDFVSQAHDALGLADMVRKKYDLAIAEFKTSVDGAGTPDPASYVRLAACYNLAGKHDEALATAEKVLAMPNLHPMIRQVAQAERARAIQAKNGAKPATPAPADTKKP